MALTHRSPLPGIGDAASARGADHWLARCGLLRELAHPGEAIAMITPNWYASVMGTGILAVAAASLPQQFPGFRAAATVGWALTAFLLVVLSVATALHWIFHRATARRHHLDPVMAHFYGAPPMAMLTVGAGTLLLGSDWIGERAAVDVDWVLWFGGTLTGLLSAVAVPYLTFTRHRVEDQSAFGGWLMPVVPPMVSATTGGMLLPHAPEGQARLTLLMACLGMFGLSLLASFVIITLIWRRLAIHKIGPARMVPTLWIVLGPLGQSITAANMLGGNAHLAIGAPYSQALAAFGVVYGVPVWGFAALWAGIATMITLRAVREHMPFSLTWWSFTFPVGTCVTGTSGLAAHTGAEMFTYAAGLLYLCLVSAWFIVAVRTVHGSLIRGTLLKPPAAPVAPVVTGRPAPVTSAS